MLLEVKNLTVSYNTFSKGEVDVVKDISFTIREGEVLALVGESGSGKTTIALSILRILPKQAKIKSGKIIFKGEDLLNLSVYEVHNKPISMIFQEPRASLDPLFSIKSQIKEALRKNKDYYKIRELLDMVGLGHMNIEAAYPHQLSGGMCQRVSIAIALAKNPELLIADEPTSALDTVVQAQIISLLSKLQEELNLSMLFITHDLMLVRQVAKRVIVINKGEFIEEGDTDIIFRRAKQNYTKKLISAACHKI